MLSLSFKDARICLCQPFIMSITWVVSGRNLQVCDGSAGGEAGDQDVEHADIVGAPRHPGEPVLLASVAHRQRCKFYWTNLNQDLAILQCTGTSKYLEGCPTCNLPDHV